MGEKSLMDCSEFMASGGGGIVGRVTQFCTENLGGVLKFETKM